MSSAVSISEDTVIAIVAGMLAAFCAFMAMRAFARKRLGIGLAWIAGSGVFAFVAYFILTFTIRLF